MTDDDHTGTMTYIRLPRIKKCRWYRHYWSEWAHPMRYYSSGWHQRRVCSKCNKTQERAL